MNTYLCTRNQPYASANCLGHTDPEARQGYYIDAESSALALALMQEHFPDDTAGFTAQLWATYCHPERVNHHRAET